MKIPPALRQTIAPAYRRLVRPAVRKLQNNFSYRLHRRLDTWRRHDEAFDRRGTTCDCIQLTTRNAPEEEWRCCEHWIKRLRNKWNAREFALRHGVDVPELYWHGTNPKDIPFDQLPESYVVRLTKGDGSNDVFPVSQGRDLFDQREATPDQLVERLERSLERARHQFARHTLGDPQPLRLLVEEFVKTPEGETTLPWNYKIWMIRAHVAAIQVVMIHGRNKNKGPEPSPSAFYDRDWRLHPSSFYAGGTLAEGIEPPACHRELVEVARKLAIECDTFIRVDLYASERGPLFGEFTATPHVGANYSAFAEDYMGRLWRQLIPNRL